MTLSVAERVATERCNISGWWLAGEIYESMLGGYGRGLGVPSDITEDINCLIVVSLAADIIFVQKKSCP